jgi:hypothetical protein
MCPCESTVQCTTNDYRAGKWALLILLAFFLPACSEENPSLIGWKNFTTDHNHVPAGPITDIAFSPEGVAMRSLKGKVGLLVNEWVEEITDDNTGTPVNYNRLAADARRIWYVDWGNFGGIVSYEKGKLDFEYLPLTHQKVMDVTAGGNRALVSTEGGPLVFTGGSPTILPATGWGTGGAVEIDRSGTFWMTAGDTLRRFENDEWKEVAVGDSSRSGFPVIACDSIGNVWFAAPGGPLYQFDGAVVHSHASVRDTITGIAATATNEIWVATYNGVYRYNGSNWQHITTGEGLPQKKVWSVAIDSSGAKWFGMEKVVSRYTGQ